MNIFSKIVATGSYLPKQVISNEELEKKVDTSDEWIIERTGIKARHIASEEETAFFMADQACRAAVEKAHVKPREIDLIICATCTPDKLFPSTACLLQNSLQVGQAIAFDISAACSGFVFALDVANQYIQNGTIKNALVVGSETMTKVVDWGDRNTCVLFGDGAGAVLLQSDDYPGIIDIKLHSYGSKHSLLELPNNILGGCDSFIAMKGKALFKFAVDKLASVSIELLKKKWF